jgi:hypothetical protein
LTDKSIFVNILEHLYGEQVLLSMMPDRKKITQAKSKATVSPHSPFLHTFIPPCHCQVETRQKTLLDLFPRKVVSVVTPPVNEPPEDAPSNHDTDGITSDVQAEPEGSKRIGATTYRIDLREHLSQSAKSHSI